MKENIDCYDEAIKLQPDYAPAYYSKGNVLYDVGKNKEAIDCYDETIKN